MIEREVSGEDGEQRREEKEEKDKLREIWKRKLSIRLGI